MNRLERRVSKLEQRARARKRVFVWREPGQTEEQAVDERFPDGAPADVEVMVISWMTPEMASNRGLAS